MRILQAGLIPLVILAAFAHHNEASAQAPGHAEITSPVDGEAVSGLVTIEGSASHPSFVSYELSFTYQQSGIETWYSVIEDRDAQIVDARLGLWDVSGISDGEYRLRLRILLENGSTLEHVVQGIRVRNQRPVETETPAPQVGPLSTSTVVPPTATARPTSIVPPAEPGNSSVIDAFQIGFGIGGAATIGVTAYLFMRRRIKIRWGILRMRRMLWQDEKKRRQGGPS